jgi:hypothetical protein
MRVARRIGRTVSQEWNALECFDPKRTCLLHYTDMNTQPWVSTANPLGHLWVACLRRALAAGFISRAEVEREVSSGYVRPSLLPQLDASIDSTLELPAAVRRLDLGFVAPYRRLRSGRSRPWPRRARRSLRCCAAAITDRRSRDCWAEAVASGSGVVVIIVTWNVSALLACVLDALARQTLSPMRVLVIDNGSDDGEVRAALLAVRSRVE